LEYSCLLAPKKDFYPAKNRLSHNLNYEIVLVRADQIQHNSKLPGHSHFLGLSGLSIVAQTLRFSVLCFIAFALVTTASANIKQQNFIDLMVTKHQFDRDQLNKVFAGTEANATILKAITTPWEAKPWYEYYPIFLTENRLKKGLDFWQQYASELAQAEQQTGVPAQIIVAIIGVETYYGSYLGKYSVFDALQTLAFYYPPRSSFFSSELEQLFLLAQEEKFNIIDLKGSYAGAMGWGQFIPSSYRAYAVDFDQDGTRDLLHNPLDAIGSVANYFKRHGWQAGQTVAFPADIQGNNVKSLLSSSLKLQHNWQQAKALGVRLPAGYDAALSNETKVKLIEFAQPNQTEYWLVLNNFYVITRYNHSPLYAMVVFQLSEQLLNARLKQLSFKATE
jgi:membrane-bound lytic murein transglycosylase B